MKFYEYNIFDSHIVSFSISKMLLYPLPILIIAVKKSDFIFLPRYPQYSLALSPLVTL